MNADDDDLPVLTQVLRTGGGRLPGSAHDDAWRWMTGGISPDGRVDALEVGEEVGEDVDAEATWPRALVIGSDPEPDVEDGAEPRDRSPLQEPAVFRNGHRDASTLGAGAFFDAVPIADPRRIDLPDNDVFLRTSPTGTAYGGLFDEPPLVVHDDADAVDARRDANAVAGASTPLPAGTLNRDVALVFSPEPSTGAPVFDSTFALRVRDSVLQELSGRIDTELDARIAQTLHGALETALGHLQTSLRVELAEALRDVVGRAVDDAIRRLDTSPQRDDLH